MVLILIIALIRGVKVFLEQPTSSLLPTHFRFLYLTSYFDLWRLRCVTYVLLSCVLVCFALDIYLHAECSCELRYCLGAYGSATLKPVYGFSNDAELLRRMWRPTPAGFKSSKDVVTKKRKHDGSVQVTGTKDLKSTQSAAHPVMCVRACACVCVCVCACVSLTVGFMYQNCYVLITAYRYSLSRSYPAAFGESLAESLMQCGFTPSTNAAQVLCYICKI